MSRTVVTGGAGFVGSHLVERLLERGDNVTVIDNLSSGRMENIKGHLANPRFNLLRTDVRQENEINDAVADSDAIIHLAAIIDVIGSMENPRLVNEVNTNGTLNLLAASVKHDVEHFIYASTAAVYGSSQRVPQSEDHPTAPISPYGASKAAGEAYCRAYYESYGLKTVILRFANIFGPRVSNNSYGGVMVKFAEAVTKSRPLIIYGDGDQTRDFIYVDDVVDAILVTLDDRKAFGEVFNIGTGKATTINDLAKLFLSASSKTEKELSIQHVSWRKGEVRHSQFDVLKAERMLSYQFKTDLPTGISLFLRWYRESIG